jgi:GTPase SAR1 family protein
LNFKNWDIDGQGEFILYWKCYYEKAVAIVFVTESTDNDRLLIAKQELFIVVKEEDLQVTLNCHKVLFKKRKFLRNLV